MYHFGFSSTLEKKERRVQTKNTLGHLLHIDTSLLFQSTGSLDRNLQTLILCVGAPSFASVGQVHLCGSFQKVRQSHREVRLILHKSYERRGERSSDAASPAYLMHGGWRSHATDRCESGLGWPHPGTEGADLQNTTSLPFYKHRGF